MWGFFFLFNLLTVSHGCIVHFDHFHLSVLPGSPSPSCLIIFPVRPLFLFSCFGGLFCFVCGSLNLISIACMSLGGGLVIGMDSLPVTTLKKITLRSLP